MERISVQNLLLLISTLLFFSSFTRGDNCGGVLIQNSGRFEHSIEEEPNSNSNSNSSCVRFIRTLNGGSISLVLDYLSHLDDELIVYPESIVNSDTHAEWPLRLRRENLKEPVNITGNTLLLIWPATNDGGFSVSWNVDDDGIGDVSREAIQRSFSVVQERSDSGRLSFDGFLPGRSTGAWLDLSAVATPDVAKSLRLSLSGHLPNCSLPDPCGCSSISIFKISESGILLRLERLCGEKLANSIVPNLPPRIVALFSVNPSPVCSELPGGKNLETLADVLDVKWAAEIENGELPETTTEVATTTTTTMATTTTTTTTMATTTTTTTTTESPKDFICPQNETIFPCVCYFGLYQAQVDCFGVNVTQETFNNLFFQLRAVNDLKVEQTLKFHSLVVRNSRMPELDLTPFMNLQLVDGLYFIVHFSLKSIIGPPTSKVVRNDKDNEVTTRLNERSIRVNNLQFFQCRLTDEGFGDALKYFDTSMTDLYFLENQMQGGHYPVAGDPDQVEFLPGLSAFTNLKEFTFRKTSFSGEIISGGQFRRQVQIESLDFGSNFNMRFGPGAFFFDKSPPNLTKQIRISFAWGYIKNADFDNVTSDSGSLTDPDSSRPIQLDFQSSYLDFLSESNFKKFILSHPDNSINLSNCGSLICDVRMKWLKDNQDLYERRVRSGYCSNDPEKKSIWETEFIP